MKIEEMTDATPCHSVTERLLTDSSRESTCLPVCLVKEWAYAHHDSLACFNERGECFPALVRPNGC